MPVQRTLALALLGLVATAPTPGCTPVALQPVTSTGLVVYSKGASQDTASVILALTPDRVYRGMIGMLERRPHVTVINRNDKRYLLEVEDRGRRLTGQATDLGRGETLLFIWVDAGDTGQTGQDLIEDAITTVCKELAVECTVQAF